mmetsp:Transcript_31494/g.40355  ORF Transcript_31494/g.40355 Transcript_31494/m.40355 type:complete len:147 (-) Transcript_31494:4-444(-)
MHSSDAFWVGGLPSLLVLGFRGIPAPLLLHHGCQQAVGQGEVRVRPECLIQLVPSFFEFALGLEEKKQGGTAPKGLPGSIAQLPVNDHAPLLDSQGEYEGDAHSAYEPMHSQGSTPELSYSDPLPCSTPSFALPAAQPDSHEPSGL